MGVRMLTEAREKKMKKFIQMNCLMAMDEYPSETAKAFIYMFESRGFKFNSIDNQDFVDYFREKRSFSDKDESKWFDNNNIMNPEWNKVSYKNIKNDRLKIRMKVTGSKLRVSELSIGLQSLGKIKPIDINRPIKEAFGELVDIFVEIADIVSDNEAKGIRRWDVDVRKQIGDKHKPKDEQSIKSKLQPLKSYFEKINYEFKISKNYDVYHISLRTLELQDIEQANHGIYYSHQFLEYSKKVPFIIQRFNRTGLWLTSFGSNTDSGMWLEFRQLSPDTTSQQHMGKDPETGEKRSRKGGKENLKYNTVREEQQEMIDRIINWTESVAKDEKIINRYYETIKDVCEKGQD